MTGGVKVPRRMAVAVAGLALFFIPGQLLWPQDSSQSAALPKDGRYLQSHSGPDGAQDCDGVSGSPYVPVDSWMYSALWRLHSLGFTSRMFLGVRPWTRSAFLDMLSEMKDQIPDPGSGELGDQARAIYEALQHELTRDGGRACDDSDDRLQIESAYTVFRGISGTPLRDSFHLGATLINDYGRPYQRGVGTCTGLSGYVTAGPFAIYGRGEFQQASSADGYSTAVANAMSEIDLTSYFDPVTGHTTYVYPQSTIPLGPISSVRQGRVLEAYISANVLHHVVSLGKSDQWLGPAQGGSFAYSNNAENIYSFQINRMKPLHIPGLSVITGPFRYVFLVGPLGGHELVPNPAYTGNPAAQPNVLNPGKPWVHVEKVSFLPSPNLEIGFERTVIWGGKGHAPVTLHTFLRSFFSLTNVTSSVKNTSEDPGARFTSFDFSYRLPFLRKSLTLYADGEVHDDVSPIAAPQNAAWRPGIYLSHVPGVPKLDVRVEAAYTDSQARRSVNGRYMYWEFIQRQGYTNNGQLFGDWIGREDKGGQAWITYHMRGDEWIQLSARHQKASKDFIATAAAQYGTTLNDLTIEAVKRIHRDFEIRGSVELERYRAPIYLPGLQSVTATNIQLTWNPATHLRL